MELDCYSLQLCLEARSAAVMPEGLLGISPSVSRQPVDISNLLSLSYCLEHGDVHVT